MKAIIQVTYHKISDDDIYRLEDIEDIEEIFICDTYGEKELLSTEIIERWEDIILDNINISSLVYGDVYQTTIEFDVVTVKPQYQEVDEGDDIIRTDKLLSHKKVGNVVGDDINYENEYEDINN